MPGDINFNLPESSGELLQEAYQDVAKPAASATGQTIGLVPRGIRAILWPLEKRIMEREFLREATIKLMEQKLERLSPDKIVLPEDYVAIPALQKISYSMDSALLRDLYANLLAKAMYQPTKDFVHPAFIEIISQLSPTDAKLFKIICEAPNTPLISLAVKEETNTILLDLPLGAKILYEIPNMTAWEDFTYQNQQISITNLERLGLLSCTTENPYVDDSLYDPVRHTAGFQYFTSELQKRFPENKIAEAKGFILVTAFGRSFYNVCINESFDSIQ